MSGMSSGADFSAHVARVLRARQDVSEAIAIVLQTAVNVDLGRCGTDELPAALGALANAKSFDETEDGACRLDRSYALTPLTAAASGGGEAVLVLTGAVMMLRLALRDLDQAKRD